MNSLSWFIYFAGFADTLSGFASFFAVVGGFLYLLFMIITGVLLSDCSEQEERSIRKARRSISWIAAPILAVCIPASLFVPSRQTLVLIAGSQMGEQALKSDAVTSIVNPGMDLVRLWIKQETDKLKKEAK
jgi:signal transduction histidine kinase